ncbi:hypothetical protein [Bradyrhizobium zhanjiangense]|uniref:hypothetical protein n=1 Tax=Bradyrhizobium zhanjiangense TaxID=1325107 RepID=UPI0013E8F0A0|nr:hypothetical protein [Bradyrhizobium zhanjiangense]
MKKFDLVSDHRLVRRPIVNIEMIDARINAELTFPRAASIAGPGLATSSSAATQTSQGQ